MAKRQGSDDHAEPFGDRSGIFGSLAENVPIGIIVMDRAGRPAYFNPRARELIDITGRQEANGDWKANVRPDDRASLEVLLHNALVRHKPGSALVTVGLAARRVRWLRVDANPTFDEHGELWGVIATLQDVSAETTARQDLLAAQDDLWRLANHDMLTGLPNRAALMDQLARALARQKRSGAALALLYCDLDGFKAVNDNYGHLAGDDVLIEVSHRLKAAVRETDTVSRFGGDEFVVMCEGVSDHENVEVVARRIVTSLAEPVAVGESHVHIGASIGIALHDREATTDELLGRADTAMYRAKTTGKGRYTFG